MPRSDLSQGRIKIFDRPKKAQSFAASHDGAPISVHFQMITKTLAPAVWCMIS
jgi:hypothetical protein